MNALGWFLTGLLAIPAACCALVILVNAGYAAGRWFDRRGVTFEAKIRDTSKVNDYVLVHNIWWERGRGPVFYGGWYHELPAFDDDGYVAGTVTPRVNRWCGLGWQDGPCVMVIRSVMLDPISSAA